MAAQAQDASALSPQFNAILHAEQHRTAVLEGAKHSTTWIKHDCQNASFAPLPTIKIWKHPEFDSSGAPTAGQWGESVEASGCGISRQLNVVTTVRSPTELVTGPLAPGNTSADPILQKDASRQVFTAAMTKAPGCKQVFLDNTQAIRKESPKPTETFLTGPVPVENWSVVVCDQTVIVEVKFLPTAAGTTIGAHAL
jgi:hypothetical protein